MINPLKNALESKKVNFTESYKINRSRSGSRNSDYRLRGAGAERNMVNGPQHWLLIINDEFFVPLQGSLTHLIFISYPYTVFHVFGEILIGTGIAFCT